MLKKLHPDQPQATLQSGTRPVLTPVAIVGSGLASLAGSSATALLSMVATRQCGGVAEPSFTIANGKTFTPALMAPVPANKGIEYNSERIHNLAIMALEKILASLPASVKRADLLIYTILSPFQDADFAAQELSERLVDQGLQKDQFHFPSSQDGSLQALAQVCAALHNDKGKTILFGGVDSLIDPGVCMDLADRKLLAGLGLPGGIIPGEAAAYLTLQAAGKSHAQEVQIKTLAAVESTEPIKHPIQLAQAITQCLEQAAISALDIDEIILPYGTDHSGALEWYHTSQKIWPPVKPKTEEAEQIKADLLATGQQPKAHYPATTLGNTGAAGLAIALLLGQARFAFQHPPVNRILICQAGTESWRGALILEQTTNKSKPQV